MNLNLPIFASRFWAKVARAGPDDCWLWMAHCTPKGYGSFRIGSQKNGTRKNVSAHRIAYQMAVGPIPRNLCVLHHCDNPPCVNPAHLFLGTKADNSRDMVSKGRQAKGMRNGSAKLTEIDVMAIRLDHRPHRAIATDYGVCHGTIDFIKTHQNWTHI